MSYLTQSAIASDQYMQQRVAQCAATEGIVAEAGLDPDFWTSSWRRTWSAAPGWDAAWESAVASNVQNPGMDQGVITDEMILSQVQSMKPFTSAPSPIP